jgi:hypothetical protein
MSKRDSIMSKFLTTPAPKEAKETNGSDEKQQKKTSKFTDEQKKERAAKLREKMAALKKKDVE